MLCWRAQQTALLKAKEMETVDWEAILRNLDIVVLNTCFWFG